MFFSFKKLNYFKIFLCVFTCLSVCMCTMLCVQELERPEDMLDSLSWNYRQL